MPSATETTPRATPAGALAQEAVIRDHVAEGDDAPNNPKMASHIIGHHSSESNAHTDSSITSENEIGRDDSSRTFTSNFDGPSSTWRNKRQFNSQEIWSRYRREQLKLTGRTTNKVPMIGHPDIQVTFINKTNSLQTLRSAKNCYSLVRF
uniref:Uncharacterized protein n=1 Tax=Parascaris equorum TaxID=6256 RepID=A0A914S5C6_PAREQ